MARHLDRVRQALRERDAGRALAEAHAAVSAENRDALELADIMTVLAHAGLLRPAFAMVEAASLAFPGSAALLAVLSEAEAARGDIERALRQAEACAALPDQRRMQPARAEITQARHLMAAGRLDDAEARLAAPLAMASPPVAALILLADIRERRGAFAPAAAALAAAARALRTAPVPWLRAVRLLLRAGQPEEAARVAEEGSGVVGLDHVLAVERSGALHACGRFLEAATVAQAAIPPRPETFALHRQAVLSLMAAGQLDAAADAVIAMLRGVEASPGVAFLVANFIESLPDPATRGAFLDRAREACPHPLIAGIGVPGIPAAPLSLRDCAPYGAEQFPPDDVIAELAEAFTGTRLPFSAQLATWGERRAAGTLPAMPVTSYTVPEARLFLEGGLFVVADREGRPIDLCARRPEAVTIEKARAAVPRGRLGRAVLVTGVGLTNYAHWCLDILPQVAVAQARFPGARVLLPRYRAGRFILESLALFGLDPALLADAGEGSFEVEELTVFNASVFPTARHALQLGNRAYARHLLDRAAVTPGAARRIFVDRPAPQRRTVINREPLLGLMERHGFERIDPGAMPVAAQAALFASATHVVGLHGAAMTNLIHCRPGTRVLELHSPDHSTTAFAIAALVTGCTYRAHVGRSAAEADRLWAAPQDMDFVIDPQALERDTAWLTG